MTAPRYPHGRDGCPPLTSVLADASRQDIDRRVASWRSTTEQEALDRIGYRNTDDAVLVRDLEHLSGLRRPAVLVKAYRTLAYWAWGCGFESRYLRYRRRARRWCDRAMPPIHHDWLG